MTFTDAYLKNVAKDFVQKLLVVDPDKRLTARAALGHPWIRTEADFDLLPNVKKNFNAKRTFKKGTMQILSMASKTCSYLVVFAVMAASASTPAPPEPVAE
jgi:serine/threonine protein kinase